MRILRPHVPVGIHVWRDQGGDAIEAAAVSDTGFEWCGRAGRTPPLDLASLAARAGRQVFGVHDDEKSEWGGLPGQAFLVSILSTGLETPEMLTTFRFPEGGRETVASNAGFSSEREDVAWPLPLWNDSSLFPAKEAARIARYRRHQSWYRENVLRAPAGSFMTYESLGSYLAADAVASDPSLNFLSVEAQDHADQRAAEVKKENGALDPVRLRQNMLSSMPMCFNLFGSLRDEPAFLILFQRMFDAAATEILDVQCEYAPQPPEAHLGDRTAFDAVVRYRTAEGARFMGIETKYTEAFSEREYDNDRYREVTRTSRWFNDPDNAAGVLKGKKSNQLWRNLMLAASVELGASFAGQGAVAVVALQDDQGAAQAISILGEHLAQPSRLVWAPIESILDAADAIPDLAEWSFAFRQRYVP